MAKLKSNAKPTDTPLSRTAALARKLLAVPKAEVDKVKQRQVRKASSRSSARQ